MKLKQTLTVVAVVAIALTGLTSCGTTDAPPEKAADRQTAVDLSKITADETLVAMLPAEIAEPGQLIVGVDPTYAPNEFKDKDGSPIGWEIDLIDAAAAKLGLTTDFRVATFDNIVPSILAGKYDIGLGGYYDTLKRQETLDMIDFFSAGNQFASAADNPIKTELDICGLKVGAPKGGSAEQIYLPELQKKCEEAGLPAFEVLGYDAQDSQTAALKLGRLDAMVSDSPVTSYAVKLSDGEFVGSPIFDEILSGAPVMKDRGEFAEAIRGAIESLVADGTYAQIMEFWGVEAGAIDEITINGSQV